MEDGTDGKVGMLVLGECRNEHAEQKEAVFIPSHLSFMLN